MPGGTDTALRLDVFLARSRLIMPRQTAKRACDNGVVSVDDRVAKPSATVTAGDRVTIRFTDQELTVRIVRMPPKSVPKNAATDYYDVIEDKRLF
jgi:ribosomal 50S subunit-recycling heat shock protein